MKHNSLSRFPGLPVLLIALLAAVLLAGSCGSEEPASAPSTIPSTGPTETAPSPPTSPSSTAPSTPGGTMSLTELAQFDGKGGRAAYVAVDGLVYDVSGSSRWSEGVHGLCPQGASAGRDLTEVINQAPPNMRSLLMSFPVVGRLQE